MLSMQHTYQNEMTSVVGVSIAYEVAGRNADEITLEVNRILEGVHGMTDNLQVAPTPQHVRVQFELEATRSQQEQILRSLKQSAVFENATPLGPVDVE